MTTRKQSLDFNDQPQKIKKNKQLSLSFIFLAPKYQLLSRDLWSTTKTQLRSIDNAWITGSRDIEHSKSEVWPRKRFFSKVSSVSTVRPANHFSTYSSKPFLSSSNQLTMENLSAVLKPTYIASVTRLHLWNFIFL